MNDRQRNMSNDLLALWELHGQLADVIIAVHRIIDQAAAMSDQLPVEHRAAINSALCAAASAADRADGLVHDRINEQYNRARD